MAESAFMSGRPEVLEGWEDWLRRDREFREWAKSLEERTGRSLMAKNSALGGQRVVGLKQEDGDEDATIPGWRIGKVGYWIPALRSKAGKDYEAELRDHHLGNPMLPGMPDTMWLSDGWRTAVHAPQMFPHRRVLYVGWACPVEKMINAGHNESDHKAKVDLMIWENIPLSQWHLALEDHNRAKVKV